MAVVIASNLRKELAGTVPCAGTVVAPGWVALLVAFFVWAPRLLTHGLISRRELLPAAALTALVLVVLMLVSSYVLEPWSTSTPRITAASAW